MPLIKIPTLCYTFRQWDQILGHEVPLYALIAFTWSLICIDAVVQVTFLAKNIHIINTMREEHPEAPARLDSSSVQFSSVQFSHSVLSDSLQPHGSQHARPPCPSPTPGVYPNSCAVESVMPSRHLILCRPLLLLPLIRIFSNESALRMRWPKYWSFSFSISPSNEHPGLISFRMDWLDLLAVQGTLRVFSNTTVQKHQFFCAQLSS